jgi:hypothetical protein
VDVAQLRIHHRAQRAAAAMRRVDADHRHARARQRTARHRQLEGQRAGTADDLAVLERRVHPLVRQRQREELEPLLARRRVEVLADRADRAAELVLVCGGTNLEHDREPRASRVARSRA